MATWLFDKEAKEETEDEFLLRRLDMSRLPAHVAIIMDGNGRWAAKRNLPRVSGHREGAASVRATVETAARIGIGHLTLFAFSTENWKRPRFEVEALMRLLREFLRKELKTLEKNDIRFQMIGQSKGFDPATLKAIRRAEKLTSKNTGLVLSIALNYGSRAEIVEACRQLAEDVAEGRLKADEIDDHLISSRLYTSSLPDPDLLIRTSGEMRISNFLLWQIAYAELYVTETFWPDFRSGDFLTALIEYQKRDRRFGAVEQSDSTASLKASGAWLK